MEFTHPEPHSFDAVDVTQPTKVNLWADRRPWGPGRTPDILINNAALMNAPAPLWKVPADEIDEGGHSQAILGVANVIRAFAPAMVERGSGVFVNLSSGWGRHASPEVAPYCATKWAIEGMTKALPSPREPAQGYGGRPAQSRGGRYRHAADLLSGGRLRASQGGRMGEAGRALHPRPGPGGQRPLGEHASSSPANDPFGPFAQGIRM